MKWVDSGTGYSHTVGYSYDELNNLTAMVETINGVEHTTSYTYDTDNRVTEVTNGNTGVTYTYDDFGRLTQRASTHNDSPRITDSYTYVTAADGGITAQVAQLDHRIGSSLLILSSEYTYDANGNITKYTYGPQVFDYTYDAANQLISEENSTADKRWVWEYDDAGNIQSRKTYDLESGALLATDTYSYGDSNWGDLLKAYNGTPITYDGVGNPLNDGTWEYTWQHGRQLAKMAEITEDETGVEWEFTYNADGMRTQRTDGTNTYTYVYSGSQLVQMTKGSDTLYFTYDASGIPVSVVHDNGTTTATYYYVTNLQGDVLHIFNNSNTTVGGYTYDAWGNLVSTGASTICQLNPLRYRGYVYDSETGLYYLQSRYYNPEMGRFINADIYAATGQGFVGNNMFAYCLNNPTNLYDSNGCIAAGATASATITGGLLKSIWGIGASNALNPVGWVLLGVAAVGTATLLVIIIVDQTSSVKETTPKKDQNQTIVLPSTQQKQKTDDDDNDIVVYRWARRRNQSPREYKNLTPRPGIDYDGLSFSLKPVSNKGNAVTTLGALRDAGFVCTVSGTHVSVMPPGGMPALYDWMASYETADISPHELTLLLRSITK